MLSFHITFGLLCIVSGVLALVFRKGSMQHRKAGLVFVFSMLAMTLSGAVLAYHRPAIIALIAAILTFYLVLTAVSVVRAKPKTRSVVDLLGLIVGFTVCLASIYYGNLALKSETGFIENNEIPAAAYFFFATIAGLCAASDMRYILIGGLSGAQRLARHLWRMGFAMYMAVSSFFTGQPQVFPEALAATGLLAVPETLVVLVTIFWFLKVLAWPTLRVRFKR